jgi:hypothetical protein
MNSIYFDAALNDDERRQRLYAGDMFVYSPTKHSLELRDFARELSEEAFAPYAPETAQHHLPVEQYVAILAGLKPKFIHHPTCKVFVRGILDDLGCDLDRIYFDVPRLRTMTADDYLAAGLAYAFHPHRDTWFSAPQCQVNWWMPVYDTTPENTMALHRPYWNMPVENSSRDYNYALWNKESRHIAAQQIKTDTRKQPKAEVPIQPQPQLRVVCPAGGIWLFSAAHMHSTVRNTSGRTRFSIDFRTVFIDDVANRCGAPNIDSACTGTTLGDFLRGSDLENLPADLVAMYDTPAPPTQNSIAG